MRVVDMLESSFYNYSRKKAVHIIEDNKKISYKKLRNTSLSIANNLKLDGYKKNTNIILLSKKSIFNFYLSFACSYLGARFIPLNEFLKDEEYIKILCSVNPEIIFCDSERINVTKKFTKCKVFDCTNLNKNKVLQNNLNEDIIQYSTEDDINLIIYSSGTTGNPKGVCISQKALCFNAFTATISQKLVHNDKYMSITPLSHAAAGLRVFTMISNGQTHYVQKKFEAKFFLENFKKYKITTLIAVPTQLKKLLNDEKFSISFLKSLRLLVYGASYSDIDLIRKLNFYFPNKLCQGYGLSEATSQLTSLNTNDHELGKKNEIILHSVGKPILGVIIQIRNKDNKKLKFNEIGEIWVKTDKVMNGYLNDLKKTNETIIKGWLKTSDIGYFNKNGYLFLKDRMSDVIISGGINIYPSEIEKVLLSYDNIIETAVVGIKDDYWGEKIYAFVLLKTNNLFNEKKCVLFMKKYLSDYKIPKKIIEVNSFEKTDSGKINKEKLKLNFFK